MCKGNFWKGDWQSDAEDKLRQYSRNWLMKQQLYAIIYQVLWFLYRYIFWLASSCCMQEQVSIPQSGEEQRWRSWISSFFFFASVYLNFLRCSLVPCLGYIRTKEYRNWVLMIVFRTIHFSFPTRYIIF